MPVFDVAIVGLGAMGSAAAWQLAQRGLRVVGLDRYAPPHHLGSSHGHSRIIRHAYFEHPQYVPMVQRADALWEELGQETGAPLLLRTGGVMVGIEGGTLVSGALNSARVHQLPHALWSAGELRDRVPALRAGDGMVALWEPRAGVLFPERGIRTMLDRARAAGATLVYDTAVTGWTTSGDGVTVATAVRDYRARRLILAAGPWMSQLLPRLGLPLTIERAVQFWFRPPDPANDCGPGRLPVFILQHADGQLLYGLPDTGHGVKIAQHHGGQTTSAETIRRLVDEEERALMRRLALEWVPGAAGPIVDATVCLYTNTPDGHFVLDRHPRHPSVILASACSGHGFKFAPAVGEILADLATDVPPRVDLAPFRVKRFGGL
jgi:sarcosine oxidase